MNVRRLGSGIILLACPVIVVGLLVGCRGTEVSSTWRVGQIEVDGKKGDWQQVGVYGFEPQKIRLGLANDEQSLYLLLITSDRMLAMQALAQGFVVRFRPEERKGANLWVGSPLAAGMGPGQGPGPSAEERGEPGSGMARPDRGGGEELIRRALSDLPEEIRIFTSAGEESLRLSSAEAARRGIEERVGYEEGYFVVEMQVPLRRDADHPQAIGLHSGAEGAVELSLSIPKRDEKTMPRRSFRRDGGGGEPPPGGSDSPEGDGRPGRGRFGPGGPGGAGHAPDESVNGLDLKLKVRLSGRPVG